MSLKERMGRVQADKVSAAVQQAKSGNVRGAVGSARAGLTGAAADGAADGGSGAADGAAGCASAAEGAADDEAVPAAGTVGDELPGTAAADDVGPYGGAPYTGLVDEGAAADAAPAAGTSDADLLTGPGAPADASLLGDGAAGAVGTTGTRRVTLAPVLPRPARAPVRATPLTDPLPLVAAGSSAVGTGGAPATGGPADSAPAAVPLSRASAAVAGTGPHAATSTKSCPFCAFEIPAVATRCGWCTSDLGDLERAADPVVVEA